MGLSLPTRGAWIEISELTRKVVDVQRSLPTRGAWIEIIEVGESREYLQVAPHTGSVD